MTDDTPQQPSVERADAATSKPSPSSCKQLHPLLEIVGPAYYARDHQHWKALFWSSAMQGLLMGLVALAFFLFHDFLASVTWRTDEYEESVKIEPSAADDDALDRLKLGGGEWWYVGLLAGAGLGIGLIKAVWTVLLPEHAFPEHPPVFAHHLRGLKCDDMILPIPLLITSAISIGCGGTCGPELPLGAAGSAMGCAFGRRWGYGRWRAKPLDAASPDNDSDDAGADKNNEGWITHVLPDFSQEQDLCIMDGLAGSIGALFPSQYLSPLLLHELGGHWGKAGRFCQMESIVRTGVSATFAYGVYTGIKDRTALEEIRVPAEVYEVLVKMKVIYLVEAAILGVICGVVGYLGLIILTIGHGLGDRTFAKLDGLGKVIGLGENILGLLLTPVVGGVMIGLLCVAAPLDLGDGSYQLSAVVRLGPLLGTGTLLISGLIKLVLVAITTGFGFVGGPIFPLLFTGVCLGTAAKNIVPAIPLLVAVPSCMAALPCAFMPAIFTFTSLVAMWLGLGGAATSPVFFACICSYATVCGIGMIQDIIKKKIACEKTDDEHSNALEVVEYARAKPLTNADVSEQENAHAGDGAAKRESEKKRG